MKNKLFVTLSLLFVLTFTACAPATPAVTNDEPSAAEESTEPTASDLQPVRLGLGFVPNVQFAPFYVAQEKGYFADEGLQVTLEYGFENDFVALAAQGEREFAVASGDQVILASAQGLPIKYVMKWYQRYPVALMMTPDKKVDQPSDLQDATIGLPGLFGASFIGWKALVYAGGINENAINLEEIGFTQAPAVQQGAVDGAMVYIANEPIQLRDAGLDVQVIEVSDYIDLVSNGIVVGETLLAENPELVQRMVQASLRGLQDTIDNPDEAFEIVRRVIPEMSDEDAPIQRQVLDASIELWRSEQLGRSNPTAWEESVEFMRAIELVSPQSDLQAETMYTNEFINTP